MAVRTERLPLTIERVLDAAVDVADAEGIDALTLRRLAAELKVHPSSIYNHVPGKDAILDGVARRLVTEAALPASVRDWPEWVRGFAATMRKLAQQHPGAFAVFTRRPAYGPGTDLHVEAALEAFVRGGFSPLEASTAVAGVALALMGLALNEVPGPAVQSDPGLLNLQPERFPQTAAAAAAVPNNSDGMWTLVVEALIRGLQHGR